jgi:predicted nucleic acid-binding protein
MRIYFDVCALGRLTDDQSQQRIQDEARAVEAALRLVRLGIHEWVASDALREEILMNPHSDRRRDALDLYTRATYVQALTSEVFAAALSFRSFGVAPMDALHLASANAADCGALLTTDDRFIRACSRIPNLPSGFVRNPIDF